MSLLPIIGWKIFPFILSTFPSTFTYLNFANRIDFFPLSLQVNRNGLAGGSGHSSNPNSLNPAPSIREEDTSFLVSNTSLTSTSTRLMLGLPKCVVDDLVLENLAVIRVLVDK